MVDRTWTGAVSEDASNPDNWDPNGVPQSGDNLLLPGGSTIDVRDNDLQGDPLVVSPAAPATLDLSHHARAILQYDPQQLQLSPARAVVEVHGTDFLTVNSNDRPSFNLSVTVNLEDHAKLIGTFDMRVRSDLIISGGDHTGFRNDGASTLGGNNSVIDTDVVGSGTFLVKADGFSPTSATAGHLEFGGSVSKGQTVEVIGASAGTAPNRELTSSLQLDNPIDFHGAVILHDLSLVDLVGLATADHWSYTNDMLSLYSKSGKTIDQLHVLSDAASTGAIHGLSVSRTAADDVFVKPGSDFAGSLALSTS